MNKEVQELLADLRKMPGVVVKKGGGGHWKVRLHGKVVGSVPASPSDWRWKLNCISQLRQNGLNLDGYERVKAEAESKEVAVESQRTIADDLQHEALTIAKRVCMEVTEAYQLPIYKGKTIGHGTRPRLIPILIDYHQATGTAIPHLNYAADSPYNVNDDEEMARLLVISLTDFGAGTQTTVSRIAYEKMKFAEAAWDWHLGKVTTPVEESVAITPAEEAYIDDQEAVDAPLMGPQIDLPAPTNGEVDDADFVVYRLIAKLAANGVSEDDAVEFAIEVRDALRR